MKRTKSNVHYEKVQKIVFFMTNYIQKCVFVINNDFSSFNASILFDVVEILNFVLCS
jgi:hypothetical protein